MIVCLVFFLCVVSLHGQIIIGPSPSKPKSSGGNGVVVGPVPQTPNTNGSGGTGIIIGPSGGSTKKPSNGGVTIGPTGQPKKKPVVELMVPSASSCYGPAYAALQKTQQALASGIIIGNPDQIVQIPTYAPLDQSLIDNYMTAIKNFACVYNDTAIYISGQPKIEINGSDSSNSVVSTIHAMMNAFLSNLHLLKRTVSAKLSANEDVLQELNQLQSVATHYSQLVDQVKQYVAKNWDALQSLYDGPSREIIFSTYALVLDKLSQKPELMTDAGVAPIESYLDGALDVWRIDLTLTPYDNASDALIAVASAASTSFENAYTNKLNAMAPESSIQSIADVTGASTPNRKLLDDALGYLKQSADAYTKAAQQLPAVASKGGGLQTLVSNLTQGIQQLNAVGSGSSDSQLETALNAAQAVSAGGAQWYGDHITHVANALLGDYYVGQGKNALARLDTFKDTLTQSAAALASTDFTKHVDLSDFFNAAGSAFAQVVGSPGYYLTASQNNYPAAQQVQAHYSNGPVISSGMLNAINVKDPLIGLAISIISDLESAVAILSKGVEALQNQDAPDLATAQAQFSSAMDFFARADAAFQNQKSNVLPYVSFYNDIPNQSFANLIGQYIVHLYLVNAQALKAASDEASKALASRYYLAAFAFSSYVSPAVKDALVEALHAPGTTVLETAQSALDEAQKTDAQYKQNKAVGDPAQLAIWDAALSATLAAYTMWGASGNPAFKDAPGLYLQCLNAYLASYALSVQHNAQAKTIELNYRQYLFDIASGTKAESLSALTTLMKALWGTAPQLQKIAASSAIDQHTGYASKLKALDSLAQWQPTVDLVVQRAQVALTDQQLATPKVSLGALLVTNTNGIYRSPLLSILPVITLGNLTKTRADTYKKQGDWAMNQGLNEAIALSAVAADGSQCAIKGFHATAAGAYALAHQLYMTLNDAANASAVLTLAQTESMLANANVAGLGIRTSLPDTSTFGEFLSKTPLYGRYFASPAFFTISADLVSSIIPAGFDADYKKYVTNTNDTSLKERVEGQLVDAAAAFYLYQHLYVDALSDSFLAKYSFLKVIQGQTVSDDTYSGYVSDALQYHSWLSDLVRSGMVLDASTVIKAQLNYLESQNKQGTLVYCAIPIKAVPQSSADMSAVIGLTVALQMYGKVTGTSAQKNFAQKGVAAMNEEMLKAYLSFSYQLYKKIEYMQGTAVDKVLINAMIEDQTEKSVLDTHRSALQAVFSNPQLIPCLDTTTNTHVVALNAAIKTVTDYFAVAQQYASQATTVPASSDLVNAATGIQGYLFELEADFLASTLFGSPLAYAYQNTVSSVKFNYDSALASYQAVKTAATESASQRAAQKRADFFMRVAKAYLDGAHYIQASPFFNTASQFYELASTVYASAHNSALYAKAQQDATRTALMALACTFWQATSTFAEWYAAYSSSPVVLPSKQTVSTFSDLVLRCGQGTASNDELEACQTWRSDILNAAVYYSYVSNTGIDLLVKQWKLTLPQAQKQSGDLPQITQYLSEKLPSGTTLPQAILKGVSKPNDLSDLLNGLLFSGISVSTGKIIEGQLDRNSLVEPLQITGAWTTEIFNIMLAVYMATYYPSVQVTDQNYGSYFTSDYQAAANALVSPASGYEDYNPQITTC